LDVYRWATQIQAMRSSRWKMSSFVLNHQRKRSRATRTDVLFDRGPIGQQTME
jgi:hypothetical protein